MADDFQRTFWAYTLLLSAGGIGAIGDAFLNSWVKTEKPATLAVASILWLTAVICFVGLLKCGRFQFGAAVVLGLLVHCSLAVVFDRLYFGGRLSGWQWVGILFGLAAIVLVGQGNAITR
jgi:hypothetical protein